MNEVSLTGEVTFSRTNETKSGKTVTNLGVKVTSERDGKTYIDGFFDVVIWNNGPDVGKGDIVKIDGSLRGKKHYKDESIWTVEVNADSVSVLESGGRSQERQVTNSDVPF